MNIEQERAAFEAFESKHGLCVTKEGELYRSHVIRWMWKAWQARAALQSQDAERLQAAARDMFVRAREIEILYGTNKETEGLVNAAIWLAYLVGPSEQSIDHARRTEGES